MDNGLREIFAELFEGLTDLMNEQTDQIVDALGERGGTETVNVVVSGNTISILETVMKDSRVAVQIKDVASSFQLLNAELEKLEKSLSELESISIGGRRMTDVTDFIRDLSNVGTQKNVDGIHRLWTIIDGEFGFIMDNLAYLTNSPKFENIKQLNGNLSAGILDFFTNLNKIKYKNSISPDDFSNLTNMLLALSGIVQKGVVDDLVAIKEVDASSLVQFFANLSQIKYKNSLKETDIKTLTALLSDLSALVKNGDLKNITKIGEYDMSALVQFFANLSQLTYKNSLKETDIKTLTALLSDLSALVKNGDLKNVSKIGEYDVSSLVQFFANLSQITYKSNVKSTDIKNLSALLGALSALVENGDLKNVSKIGEYDVSALVQFFANLSQITYKSNVKSTDIKNLSALLGALSALVKNGDLKNIEKIGDFDISKLSDFFTELSSINFNIGAKPSDIKSVSGLLTGLSDLVKNDVLANLDRFDAHTAEKLSEFFDALGQVNFKSANIQKSDLNNYKALMSVISDFANPEFLDNIKRLRKVKKKHIEGVAEFLTTLANSFNEIPPVQNVDKKFVAMINVISQIAQEDFIRGLRLAEFWFGKKLIGKGFRINPTTIPEWIKAFIHSFDLLIVPRNFSQTVKDIQTISNILDTVTVPEFLMHLVLANMIYGRMKDDKNPIAEYFVNFLKTMQGFSDEAENEKLQKALSNFNLVVGLIEQVGKPSFIAKLVFANAAYKRISDAESIAVFFGNFVEKVYEELGKREEKIETNRKVIGKVSELVDILLKLSWKFMLFGILGPIMVSAIPGLLMFAVTMKMTLALLDWIADSMDTNSTLYSKSLDMFVKNLKRLLFAVSILLLTIAVASIIPFKGILWLGVVVASIGAILFMLSMIATVIFAKSRFSFNSKVAQICRSLLTLSLALLALAVAISIASTFQPRDFVMMLGVIAGMALILGLLWLIGLTGVGPIAIAVALGIAGVMVALSFALLLVMGALALCKFIYQDIPYIKIVVRGIVDIMWEIGLQAALLGLLMPALVAFGIGTSFLLLSMTVAVGVALVARFWKSEDKRNLKNIIKTMIEIFDLVDTYFGEKHHWLNKLPLTGLVLKTATAFGAAAGLIAFSFSMAALMLVVGETILVAKMTRLVGRKDIRSLHNVIQMMMDIFDSIDSYFAQKHSILDKLPLSGNIIKVISAFGSAATVVLFALAVGALMLVVTGVILVTKLASWVKKKDMESVREIVGMMIDIIMDINKRMLGPLAGIFTMGVAAFSKAMLPLELLMAGFIKILKDYASAEDELGSNLKDKSKEMIDAFVGFFKTFNDSISFMQLVSMSIKSAFVEDIQPTIETIGKFVDVISKVATMTFMTGFDQNGNPIYEKIPETCFADAATVVTDGFSYFLTTLSNTFDNDISYWAKKSMESMAENILPLMQSVAAFVDAIVKLSTAQIAIDWKDGKPTRYKQLDFGPDGDAAAAATCVAGLFGNFMIKLGEASKDVGWQARRAMSSLSESMIPLMTGVSNFADAILKLATGQMADKWDDNGNPTHYIAVSKTQFETAAQILSDYFGVFIHSLAEGANELGYFSDGAASTLAESMGVMMTSVADFAEAIVKLAGASIPVEFYSDGKVKKYKTFTKDDFQNAADFLINKENGIFFVFLNTLTDGTLEISDAGQKTMEIFSDSLQPIFEGVSGFVDSIIKMASGVYVDHYDDNGNPHNIKIESTEYTKAAKSIVENFSSFVSSLGTGIFAKRNEIQKTMEALNKGGIGELMVAVGDFVEAIEKYASGNLYIVKGFDEDGKPIYAKDSRGYLLKVNTKVAAQRLANGFSVFVKTLASQLSSDSLKSNIEKSKKVISSLSEIMNPVSEFTDALVKLNEKQVNIYDFAELGSSIGTGMINILLSMDTDDALTKYGSDAMTANISNVVSSVESVVDMLEDLANVEIAEGLESRMKNAGLAMIAILKGIDTRRDGSYGALQYYGTDAFKKNLKSTIQNLTLATDAVDKFGKFLKYDFQNLLMREKAFAEDLRFLMTINVQAYEQKFATSVQLIIKHLCDTSKQLNTTTSSIKKMSNQAVASINAIDRALAQNESARNRRFQDLCKNLENVTDKLGTLKDGIDTLRQNGLDSYLSSLTEALNSLNEAAARVQNYNETGRVDEGGNGGGGNQTNQNNVIVGDNMNGRTFNFTFTSRQPNFFAGTLNVQ